jgi:tRNA A-37 threonylcarbamoyl transferase component Bud32/tetratricopeptide (TPR) repeat protein/TolB-like protein
MAPSEDLMDRMAAALADRYRIEEEIGRGGMATVYRAQDLRHHRTLAIKVLHPELSETLGEKRFLGEIRTAAKLNHPHILPLFDSGAEGGLLFYVMPFATGDSLRALLDRERQLPLEEAVQITRELADALAYAHGEGIVHRDVKPENVMLEGGHAVLADFGVAQAVSQATEERLTRTGTSLGTPTYMSPEQAAGDGDLDGRSDQYALACVLYEMLAGMPPFRGPTGESLARQHLAELPPPVTQLRSTVPRGVVEALTRALAKSPADRFRTVSEFGDAVAAGARQPKLSAAGPPPAPAFPGGGRWRPGLRTPLWTAALMGVGALVLLVWLGIRSPGPGPEISEDPRVLVVPYENQTGDPDLNPVGRWVAEWITEGLARTAEVRVVPNLMVLESLARVRAREEAGPTGPSVQGLAEATGASLAVTGRYYLRGDEIEFHSEVIDLVAEEPLGVVGAVRGPVDAPSEALTEVQDRVMGVLATRLRPGTAWEVPASVQPPTYEAFQHYARASEYWVRGRYGEAAEGYMRAYEADTTFLRSLLIGIAAYGQAGDARRMDSLFQVIQPRRDELAPYDRYRLDYGMADRRGDLPGRLQAARAGVDLVSGGTLHLALVSTLGAMNRPREALDNLQEIWPETQALFPEWFVLWNLQTELHHRLGDHVRELELAREGKSLSPGSLHMLTFEGRALAALGDLEALEEVVDQILGTPSVPGRTVGESLEELALELRAHGHEAQASIILGQGLSWVDRRPTPEAGSPGNRLLLARLLYLEGRWEEALEVFRELAAEGVSSVAVVGYQGVLAARLGHPEGAREISRELSAEAPTEPRALKTLWQARIAAVSGKRDEAMAFLRRAYQEGMAFGLWLHRDVDLETLRGYPPFQEWTRPKG